MSDIQDDVTAAPVPVNLGPLMLAAGGFAAAFGAASCCALPMLFAALGVGGAWLAGVAWLAAPHRIALLGIATICVVAGALALWRGGRAAACPPGRGCARTWTRPVTIGLLGTAAGLAVLGFLYA
jgi:mercuric ion transport protein